MNVLSAMLPELLGSLLSGTVLGVTTWCLRRQQLDLVKAKVSAASRLL
ncbi:hypothetical protein ACFXPZ_14080 [Streptomyces sp. NPDC059101]